MSVKIHMMDVGDADAIIVQLERFSEKLVLLIDGGKNSEHADKIIEYFGKLQILPDILICTHLDKDHIGGLGRVLEQFHKNVKSIWVHIPTKHDDLFKTKLMAKIVDKKAFGRADERLELIFASVHDLENFVQVADKLGLKISEPFSDTTDQQVISICKKWGIEILGPSLSFYDSLVPLFREAYAPKAIYESALIKAAANPCLALGQEGYDTPENESSLIFSISDNTRNYLFTGDAGLQAFNKIEDKLKKLYLLKIPHHGSKKNLNQGIIEKISPQKCLISASGKQGHPDSNLIECLRRHGAEEILSTSGHGNLTLD